MTCHTNFYPQRTVFAIQMTSALKNTKDTSTFSVKAQTATEIEQFSSKVDRRQKRKRKFLWVPMGNWKAQGSRVMSLFPSQHLRWAAHNATTHGCTCSWKYGKNIIPKCWARQYATLSLKVWRTTKNLQVSMIDRENAYHLLCHLPHFRRWNCFGWDENTKFITNSKCGGDAHMLRTKEFSNIHNYMRKSYEVIIYKHNYNQIKI